jgi:biotin-dependent carboxylase-like uncharacterized protein
MDSNTTSLRVTGLRVVKPGPFSTFQDLGRRGRGHQGVARSGAFDQQSHRLANRLVGNDLEAATIEILLGPCEFESTGDVIVSITGTDALPVVGRYDTTTDVGSRGSWMQIREASCNVAFVLHAGEYLRIGTPLNGLRTYLSARGGFAVTPVFGSRSYDSLGQIGPSPLRADDLLLIGSSPTADAWFEVVPLRLLIDPIGIPLLLGPRHDWLSETALASLESLTWTIDPASNRTGIRFAGPPLERRQGELPSEAMIPGAVQLPPSGLPIVLGPDGGTTGGYPVIGVIPQSGLDSLAQRRPGQEVRFNIREPRQETAL